MKSFKNFINIEESLVVIGNKPYPKFGNVVILAGGAGSGKGFILSNLIAIDAKVFDVDEVKQTILKMPKYRDVFFNILKNMYKSGKIREIPNIYDKKIRESILKNPIYVSALHLAATKIGLTQRLENKFFAGLISNKHKPNIVFDVTLKDITKLHNISNKLITNGYDKKNIHIVWIVNDIKVAIRQNLNRERVVPEDILIDTHEGVSKTLSDIIKMGKDLKKYVDGDIIIVPNKKNVDSKYIESKNGEGGYFIFADKFKIKTAGKPIDNNKISKELIKKIIDYVPKGTFNINS